MDKTRLLKRLHDLEKEIELLRAELEPTAQQNKFSRWLQKLFDFVISQWVLLSFIIAVVTAIYVNVVFDVDYFEDYRNISTNKKVSGFYRQLGDRLMAATQWQAAEAAYRTAVEINPNNVEATYGIVKTQVFQPAENEAFPAPEVVDAKLAYLLSLFPDDYQVYFLKGIQDLSRGDNEHAILWFEKTIALNPDFTGSYINLGYTYLRFSSFDIEKAMGNFRKVLELDPNNALAHTNLGEGYIVLTKFEEAIEHLRNADVISSRLITHIHLGNAYRYSGDYHRALQVHRHAQSVMNEPEIEKSSYLEGGYLFNYMPQQPGDLETIRYHVEAVTVTQKKAILYYALSFDYALNKDFDAANRQFEAAFQLDQNQLYRDFAINDIHYMVNFLQLDDEVQAWFEERAVELASTR